MPTHIDLHKLYLRLPRLLQDLCVTIEGAKLNRIRYGRIYKTYLHNIREHLFYDKRKLREYQRESLRELLLKAYNIPYYRELFEKIKFRPEKFHDLSQLRELPTLDKSILQEFEGLFLRSDCDRNKLIKVKTTGTTGKPLVIYCTSEIRQKHYAFYNRYLMSLDLEPDSKRATFGGRIIVPFERSQPPFWKYSLFQHNLLFSSYHLKLENVEPYVRKLKRYGPDYIECYPSSIYSLACLARNQKLDLRGVTGKIITSGETLYEHQRSMVEDVFGARIYDHYGAAEMCVFIAQCEQGSYHIHSDYSVVEFLKEDGSDASPGEEADVVCTSLLNDVMPLIRYRIGDRAILGEGNCKCGLPFPTVEKIVGRKDDIIITPDGRRIGRLSPVLKGFPIKEAQYVQESVDSLVVKLVKSDGFSNGTEIAIKKELEKRVGKGMRIRFVYVRNIERGPGGKFRSVVSAINKS